MKYQNATFAEGVFTIICPHCSSGLAVDETQLGQINDQLGGRYACAQGACGQEIEFPSTEEAQAIMAGGVAAAPEPAAAAPSSPAGAAPAPPPQANPAAKPTEPPSKAPTAQAPATESTDSLVKPAEEEIVVGFGGGSSATLEREAAGMNKLLVKTFLRGDFVKDKKDTFDEEVSKFLSSLEEENLVGVHPVQYTADEKKGNDFGVMILYKSVPRED